MEHRKPPTTEKRALMHDNHIDRARQELRAQSARYFTIGRSPAKPSRNRSRQPTFSLVTSQLNKKRGPACEKNRRMERLARGPFVADRPGAIATTGDLPLRRQVRWTAVGG